MTVRVRLLQLPLEVHARAQAHSDGLMREFQMMREQAGAVPARLLELVAVLDQRFGGMNDQQEREIEQALTDGRKELAELVFEVPREAAGASGALGGLLDEADDYCREGQHLLMMATPPELVRYRRWFLAEFVRQIEGAAPTAWPDYRPEPDPPGA